MSPTISLSLCFRLPEVDNSLSLAGKDALINVLIITRHPTQQVSKEAIYLPKKLPVMKSVLENCANQDPVTWLIKSMGITELIYKKTQT